MKLSQHKQHLQKATSSRAYRFLYLELRVDVLSTKVEALSSTLQDLVKGYK